jgi:hypothetical protein
MECEIKKFQNIHIIAKITGFLSNRRKTCRSRLTAPAYCWVREIEFAPHQTFYDILII